jgi:hypothetical protein
MSDDLVDAAQCLADVLARENEALKRLDYPSAVALSQAKEAALTGLAKHPIELTLPPRMAVLAPLLRRLATENQELLERAIAVQTRVVRIVARACTPPPAAKQYGGHGRRAPSDRASAMALSTRA